MFFISTSPCLRASHRQAKSIEPEVSVFLEEENLNSMTLPSMRGIKGGGNRGIKNLWTLERLFRNDAVLEDSSQTLYLMS